MSLFRFSGAFRERLRNSWVEMRENPARSALQALGVILGVASVLGGFSISDSQRRRSDELYVRLGGLDKLNVQPNPLVIDGTPSALQTANLGLRRQDADEGLNVMPALVEAARAGATVGEMTDVFRQAFGEFQEPSPW